MGEKTIAVAQDISDVLDRVLHGSLAAKHRILVIGGDLTDVSINYIHETTFILLFNTKSSS